MLRSTVGSTLRIAAVMVALATGAACHAQAGSLPKIASVAFSVSKGRYSATITGQNFGAAPSGIPCNDCTPEQLQVVDLANQPTLQAVNVTVWSDTSITVTGIAADAGDAMRLGIYNAMVGSVAAWGGLVSPNAKAPVINRIRVKPNGAHTIVTITGSGFGSAPPQVGQDTTSAILLLTDWNNNDAGESPGGGFPWSAGFCNAHSCNAVTAIYKSWSDSKIVIAGFGSEYGGHDGDWVVTPQNAFCVGIWPSSSKSQGTSGGAVSCLRVGKK